MSVLENIEPKRVFKYFEDLCAVPHGSGNNKAAADLIEKFAKGQGLWYRRDESDNIIIKKPGTAGYENSEPVIIQGHMDMVCEKEEGCTKDMEKEGIDLVVNGDIISADGTTLGADNGIAVAMAMALLESDDIAHPPLEAVITTDEEIGMFGAAAIDMSDTSGKRMINIDSEDEGVFTVGCAGGNVTRCELEVSYEEFDGDFYTVTISGLAGGHSGVEIDKGRANSNILLGRVLYELSKSGEIRIASVSGGMKDNAIPVSSICTFAIKGSGAETICEKMSEAFSNEFRVTDSAIKLNLEKAEKQSTMDEISTKKVICMLKCLPNGIMEMSADIPGLVQTSLNLGVLKTEGNIVSASFCVRSNVGTQKTMVVDKIMCLMDSLSGTVSVTGDYPAWEYRANSPVRDLFKEVFEAQYGYTPKIAAIHAGVECGIFAGKVAELDCIAIGPDMKDIHTPRERVSASSVDRTWKLILEVLKRMK